MSGSLYPCVPERFLVKFSPPLIAVEYHFENSKNDKYFHEIYLEKHMLAQSEDEICTYLYVSEPYYFNQKYIKRTQVSLQR